MANWNFMFLFVVVVTLEEGKYDCVHHTRGRGGEVFNDSARGSIRYDLKSKLLSTGIAEYRYCDHTVVFSACLQSIIYNISRLNPSPSPLPFFFLKDWRCCSTHPLSSRKRFQLNIAHIFFCRRLLARYGNVRTYVLWDYWYSHCSLQLPW